MVTLTKAGTGRSWRGRNSEPSRDRADLLRPSPGNDVCCHDGGGNAAWQSVPCLAHSGLIGESHERSADAYNVGAYLLRISIAVARPLAGLLRYCSKARVYRCLTRNAAAAEID